MVCRKNSTNASEQTVEHILWKCSSLKENQKELIKKLRRINVEASMNMAIILKEPNIVAFKIIMEYLKMCNIQL